MKISKKPQDNQKGMTGIETAVILIAFVVVAAIFGYSILSSGLFSAERGKEGIYMALKGAKTNLELAGSVTGIGDNVTYAPINMLGQIKFTVRNTIAGVPIDMTPNIDSDLHENACIISLTTKHDHIENVQWTYTPVGDADADNLLEKEELFEITIDINNLTPAGCALTIPEGLLQANDTFMIQMKPALGSTVSIQRQLPPAVSPVMDLH